VGETASGLDGEGVEGAAAMVAAAAWGHIGCGLESGLNCERVKGAGGGGGRVGAGLEASGVGAKARLGAEARGAKADGLNGDGLV